MIGFKKKSVTALGITVFATVGAALNFDAPLESSMFVASLPILIALYHIFRCFQSIEDCEKYKGGIDTLRSEISQDSGSIGRSKRKYTAVWEGGYSYMTKSQKPRPSAMPVMHVDLLFAMPESEIQGSEFSALPGSFLTNQKGKRLIIITQISAMLFSLFYSTIILLLTIRVIKPNTSLYDRCKWLALGSAVLSGLITLLQHLYTRLLRKQANKLERLHSDTEKKRDDTKALARFEANKLTHLNTFEQLWHDWQRDAAPAEMTRDVAYAWFRSQLSTLVAGFLDQRVALRKRAVMLVATGEPSVPGGVEDTDRTPLLQS